MADIPQDPRQLARDILSGKIKLEDLQREQQRRQAGASKPAARPADDRPVPLPNMNRPRQAPPANQQETIPMPAPLPVPQRQQPAPQRRPVPQQQRPVQKQTRKEPPKPVRAMPPSQPVENKRVETGPPAAIVTSAAKENAANTRNVIRAAVRNPKSLRHAIILSEILQPPVSMR